MINIANVKTAQVGGFFLIRLRMHRHSPWRSGTSTIHGCIVRKRLD
jgi:hypothetical protein